MTSHPPPPPSPLFSNPMNFLPLSSGGYSSLPIPQQASSASPTTSILPPSVLPHTPQPSPQPSQPSSTHRPLLPSQPPYSNIPSIAQTSLPRHPGMLLPNSTSSQVVQQSSLSSNAPTNMFTNMPLSGTSFPFVPPMMVFPYTNLSPAPNTRNAATPGAASSLSPAILMPPTQRTSPSAFLPVHSVSSNLSATTAASSLMIDAHTAIHRGTGIADTRFKAATEKVGDSSTTGGGVEPLWTEHTSNDGKKYYYSAQLGTSRWDKPDELKNAEELRLSSQTPWKEYTTSDGRSYWYNKDTKQSVWELPEEIRKLRESIQTRDKNAEAKHLEWPKFETKGEAREHFKILFEEKHFAPRTTWETALKSLESDKRWSSLVLLTKGEKKQLFSEYMSQAQKRLQEEDRRKRRTAREHVVEILSQWSDIHPDSTYVQFAEAFHEKEWWTWIDEKERDDLFQEFMDEFERESKEKNRRKRKECMEELKQRYMGHRSLNFLTKWKVVKQLFKDDEQFNFLDQSDCLSLWEEYVKEGMQNYRERVKTLEYRKERKCRAAFEELLNEMVLSADIHPKCDWLDVVATIQKDQRYIDMIGQRGSTPRELFEEKLEDLMEQYENQKSIVKLCVRQAGFTITPSTTFESFYESLRPQEEMVNVSVINARLIFQSLQDKSIEKEKEAIKKEAKRRRKLADIFNKLLTPSYLLGSHMDYDTAVLRLMELGVWDAVCEVCSREETRKLAYMDWMESLKEAVVKGDDEREEFPIAHTDEESSEVLETTKQHSKKRRAAADANSGSDGSRHRHRHTSRSHHGHRASAEDEWEDGKSYEKHYRSKSKGGKRRKHHSKSESESDEEWHRKTSERHRRHHYDDEAM